MTEEALYCTFRLADHLFGIGIEDVQEVLRSQEITRVPLSAPAVRGVVNLRGRIVPAVDLRRCFEMEPFPPDRAPAHIVVRGAGSAAASLLVDEIGSVVDTTSAAYAATPATLRGRARDLLVGVYKLQGEILLVLAIGTLLRAAFAEAPAPLERS